MQRSEWDPSGQAGWPDYPRMVHRAVLIPILAAIAVERQVRSARGRCAARACDLIGDSIATTIQYDAAARPILAKGIDLDLQLAVCCSSRRRELSLPSVAPPTLVASSRCFGWFPLVVGRLQRLRGDVRHLRRDRSPGARQGGSSAHPVADVACGAAVIPAHERDHRGRRPRGTPSSAWSTGTSTPEAIPTGSSRTGST